MIEKFKSNAEAIATADKYLYGNHARMPIVMDRGEGCWVWDLDNNKYLDFVGGIAVNGLGHHHPAIVEALDRAKDMMHCSNYYYNEPAVQVCKLICENSCFEKVLFANSGAEANEGQIKLARKYAVDHGHPERYVVISMLKSFHGRTLATATATGQEIVHNPKWFSPLPEGFRYAEFNNLDAFKAAYVEGKTCAIMFEPVQGEGGVFPATDEFIQGIRKFCDEKGILMLLDEVQAGWGRCGDFMCYMTYGIKPDVVSMAKAMGGGMPIGGIACTDRVATAFGPGTHGSTYAGHPVSCAASLAVLRELKAGKWPENAKKVGDYFAAELAKMPHVVTVRHRGLFVGVVLEDGINAVEVKRHCIKNHFLVTAIGANIIRMVPPLTIREVDCDEAVARLSKSINEVAEGK